jgi:hypothetical protein
MWTVHRRRQHSFALRVHLFAAYYIVHVIETTIADWAYPVHQYTYLHASIALACTFIYFVIIITLRLKACTFSLEVFVTNTGQAEATRIGVVVFRSTCWGLLWNTPLAELGVALGRV